ncbi:aminopeptidase O [Nephila pilipes]|uniref:Aminopeptidase O n=1 Tax=Nephila pilipes TaxID=299642 RepID=A0A8X6TCY2_NEPPI|nr:aminopeptidase O [Nephila pilipes]
MTECLSLDEDLPLVSNIEDILVCHYNFNFKCDFETKTFTCFALLFLQPVSSNDKMDCCVAEQLLNSSEKDSTGRGFVLILDCHKILVKRVTELKISADQFQSMMFSPLPVVEEEELSFVVTDWSLKIWKNSQTCKFCFPKVIRIFYDTITSCPSVLWVNDQNQNPAVFTYGAFINNRALFPCQEPPTAMATWEAVITVMDSSVVLMSGDEEPQISHVEKYVHYYYYTKKVLPLSTLCLAIGTWNEYLIPLEDKNDPKCRIFACSNLIDKAIQELSEYIPQCLKASQELLGPYPFPRIDFLIIPPTFSSLGMASPNLVFLSQSLLSGDRSLCCRVSHEVAHGWFGLSIGALDWTEEWLSEGFATFVEDILHTKATQMTCNDSKNYMELKALIRKKILMDEIENTQEDLQILRASYGENSKHIVDGINATVLKNGQNPIKGFIQVHYIKGYFLLKYLSELVEINNFSNFLKAYVLKYEGQLVTSKEFIGFFLNSFPSLSSSLSIENIYENWLHNSGTASEIKNLKPSLENQLYLRVWEETKKWKKFNSSFMKKKPKRRKPNLDHFCILTSDQTILLLENLLGLEQLHTCTLHSLDEVFLFKNCNAEVLHRWLELVVKHNYKCQFNALKDFLIHHMAMGVYLYGELIYSEDEKLQEIARECYFFVKDEMEPNFRRTLEQMFLQSNED